MTGTKGKICDLAGKPLVNNAYIEIDETPGVSVWGGNFRLPQPAPPMDLFRPQCVVKLQDGRQGKVTIGRFDRSTAYFLGNGKLEVPPGGAEPAETTTTPVAPTAAAPAATAPQPRPPVQNKPAA